MGILAVANPDPSTPVTTAVTTGLLALTAFDTSALRLQFTAPTNGCVLVRVRMPLKGNVATPMVHLGVLEGSTIRGRMIGYCGRAASSTVLHTYEVVFVVPGLTAGTLYTWDAAYGVDVVQTTTQFGWGGLNDTTAGNAYGAACFEIWDTPGLLGAKLYDPTPTAVTKPLTAATAMAAFDTTQLRIPFTVPASGNVLARIRCAQSGNAATPSAFLGIMDGSNVKLRQAPLGGNPQASSAVSTDMLTLEMLGVITNLTPGASLNYDAAWACETAQTGAALGYGGPNDAVGANTWGAIGYELWAA